MPLFLFVASLLSVANQLWAKEICCPGLPCYGDNKPFANLPLPQCPKDINIQMTVYTQQDSKTGQTITRDAIPPSFKDNVMTMFIVHGWTQTTSNPWMIDMKDAALAQEDYNVILVSWRGAMEHFFYDQSASNTRSVGGEIALVSNNIISKGKSSRALMYCVGHSLGAHVCGHAGTQGQFERITGMDPAGPLFEDQDWSVGLNPSCADLVDNIHTNTELIPGIGAGMMKAVGHIDFYPNGGRSQPGCALNQYGVVPGLKDFLTCNNQLESCDPDFSISCSHSRVYALFTESIRTPCFLSHFSCSDQRIVPFSCTESADPVQSMGFRANKYPGRGIFYLKTKACAPFCCKEP